jgi:hypothetical protein
MKDARIIAAIPTKAENCVLKTTGYLRSSAMKRY